MCQPGSHNKYYTIHAPLDDARIAEHLAGSETYGAVLIGRDGLAEAGAIELDIGADEAARRALTALADAGITAFSIVTPGSDGHNGSHTWALYRSRGDPDAIQAQLCQVAAAAGLPAREIFPANQTIRLPFGLHRRTRRRGVLLLQDGRRFNLDAGELSAAIRAVIALPRNTVPPLPVQQVPPAKPREAVQLPSSADVIGDYCRTTDLTDLLVSYPGYHIVSQSATGAIVRCGCPHHKHGDKRPSLEVKQGRDGRQVLLGYAPGCIWHNERGRNDAFNVYCELERLSSRDAVKRLAKPPPAPQRKHPPHPADEPAPRPLPDDQARAARERNAERKRTQRRADAQVTRLAVEARLERDAELSERGRVLLQTLLEVAGERDWCRPSVARLVEISGYSERTVQYALADLEAAGYIASTPVRAGTTYRRFLAPVETSAASPPTKPEAPAPIEASAPASCPSTVGVAPVETSDVATACALPGIAPIETSNGRQAEPAPLAAPVETSRQGAVAPESGGESESGYKQKTCEGRGEPHSRSAHTLVRKHQRTSPAPEPGPLAQTALWEAESSARNHTFPACRKGKPGGLPRRAWPHADLPALEQELQRRRGMLRHLKRGPARSAVERTVHQLAEQIAARREVGLVVMQYANAPSPRCLDNPRSIAEGGAVAYEGGTIFTPPGTSPERLLAKLERAVVDHPAGPPTPPPSQADRREAAPDTATALSALPPGWSVERCDHKGNLTAYGIYWRARGPSGDTEPTMYLDTAWREAWRAAGAAGHEGGHRE